MLKSHESPSMTEYRLQSGTEKARHVQWRKLSRKRRRKLISRTLKKLEREAKRKSVFVGLDDYSHVKSLVFSELPYNPNGHHCSCNCLDDVTEDPELEVYGWNYGKMLRRVEEEGLENDADDEEGDDVALSDYGATLSGWGTAESRQVTSEGVSTTNKGSNDEGAHSARSFMGGSLGLKFDSARSSNHDDNEMFRSNSESVKSTRKSIGSTASNRNVKSRSIHKGCLCDRLVSRGSVARRTSIASATSKLGMSPRIVCSKCKHLHSVINNFKQLNNGRRISLAKDDGSLRSKIFGLRQKLRHYNDVIDRSDYLSMQQKVKRRKTIAEMQQKQALGLSDEMKLMKVKEMIYRSKNEELRKRLDGEESDNEKERAEIFRDAAKAEMDEGENRIRRLDVRKGFMTGPYSRKGIRNRRENTLPALLEEDEEQIRETHSASGRIERRKHNGFEEDRTSFDLLFINHSDNEVEKETADDTDDDNDDLSRSWPIYKRDSKQMDIWRFNIDEIDEESVRSLPSQTTVITKTEREIDPVKRLVHRLDSGLSFGVSSPSREIIDETFVETKTRIDNEKLSGFVLEESEYYKPLIERQKSFGEEISSVIDEEIDRIANLSVEKKVLRSDTLLESGQRKELLNDEADKGLLVDDEIVGGNVEGGESDDAEVIEIEFKRLSGIISEFDEESGRPGGEKVDEGGLKGDAGEMELKNALSNREYSFKLGGMLHYAPGQKLVDLTTLRTLAQKHQTLKTLGRLDEELYKVSTGADKLNTYRKKTAHADILNEGTYKAVERTKEEDAVPLSAREKKFTIPDPINKKSIIETEIAKNEEVISKIDFKYDMIRDLRYMMLNQHISRPFTYSYLKAAPPYLKKKWQHRVKRGFLRGVKEDKVTEKHLEKVEDVTYNLIDRSKIHKETLKKRKTSKVESESQSARGSRAESRGETPGARRLSTARRSSSVASSSGKRSYTLPPLKIPSSRTPSPADHQPSSADLNYDSQLLSTRSRSFGADNLKTAFKKLTERHRFAEKTGMMRNVIRLSSNTKNDHDDVMIDSDRFETDRSFASNEAEDRFTSRLNTTRRKSMAAVQNYVTNDALSGRISVHSMGNGRKKSMMQPIQEN